MGHASLSMAAHYAPARCIEMYGAAIACCCRRRRLMMMFWLAERASERGLRKEEKTCSGNKKSRALASTWKLNVSPFLHGVFLILLASVLAVSSLFSPQNTIVCSRTCAGTAFLEFPSDLACIIVAQHCKAAHH